MVKELSKIGALSKSLVEGDGQGLECCLSKCFDGKRISNHFLFN